MKKPSRLFRWVSERLMVCYLVPHGAVFRQAVKEYEVWVDGLATLRPRDTQETTAALISTTAEAIAQSENWKHNPEMGRCWEEEGVK